MIETPPDIEAMRAIERQKYLRLVDHPTYGSSNHGAAAADFVKALGPRRLVDLGCGRNLFCESLRNRFPVRAVGVDFAFPQADISAPMHAVPLEDGFADIVTAFDSLEHLLPAEVDEVVSEIGRLLKPGGKFIATISTRESRFAPGLHPTVRPLDWWTRRLARIMRIDQRSPYIVGTRSAAIELPANPADALAISRGTKAATSDAGMPFWTADFQPAYLRNWYRRRRAFLLLSGPSLRNHDLTELNRRGIVTLGVNNSWLVHRPTLWTCVDHPNRFADIGWKDAGIVKFVPAEHRDARLRVPTADGGYRQSQFTVAEMPSVWLYRRGDGFDHERFIGGDSVHWGCRSEQCDSLGINGKRSVFQAALSLLAHLGFREVYLVGADFSMSETNRYAFDEHRSSSEIKHNNTLYQCLNERMVALRQHFAESGFRVLNTTPNSGLTAFDSIDFSQAVEQAAAEAERQTSSVGWY